jgi:hypothetical protein
VLNDETLFWNGSEIGIGSGFGRVLVFMVLWVRKCVCVVCVCVCVCVCMCMCVNACVRAHSARKHPACFPTFPCLYAGNPSVRNRRPLLQTSTRLLPHRLVQCNQIFPSLTFYLPKRTLTIVYSASRGLRSVFYLHA